MLAGCEAAKLCFQREGERGWGRANEHGTVWETRGSGPKTGVSAAKLCC